MKLSKLLVGAAFAFSCAFASASYITPAYSGETASATALISGTASASTTAGYYLWNDANSSSDWYLRWTGRGATGPIVDWNGSIVFWDSNLGATSEYKFEAGGIWGDSSTVFKDIFFLSGADVFSWDAATNATGGIDGIKFTLTDTAEVMRFSLGSSLFSDLLNPGDAPKLAGSSNIFIGSGLASTEVLLVENHGMVYQQFEVAVPEPGTLALLGLGLLGLGVSRRRQA